MTLTLGIFELFTYAIPGGMQLTILIYLAVRFNVVDIAHVANAPGVLLLVVAAIASYLLGHLTYLAGLLVDRITPFKFRKGALDAWEAVVDAPS